MMPEESKPSFYTSTLSLAFLGSLIFYGVILLVVAVGLLFFKADVENAKLIIGWASALQAMLTSAYLTARRVNSDSKGAPANEPVKPVV